ncbi:hypothetical protein ACSSS7_005396 [Eimeria intestinalis]
MEAKSLDTFKLLMESVTTVTEISMDTEMRLTELQEIYSTLLSYSSFVDGEEKQELCKLSGAWKDLRNLAHCRKRQLVAIKAKFALEKQREARNDALHWMYRSQVSDFIAECKALQQRFEAGPAGVETELEEGLEAIRDLQEEISAFKRRAADLNSAENLFSLPISPFPVLERLEQDVHELHKVYALYADHDSMVKEWAGQLWAKVDLQVESLVKVQNRTRLLVAKEEMKLEKDISKIESCWRQQTVEIARYKSDSSRFVLKSNDELRMLLDDNLLQLQSMLSSRFAAAMTEKIRKWEKSLNIIREVLDAWLQVQRKWMYLDGIFTESIDIRLQLPEEAKKFEAINRRFLSMMRQISENPNVLSAFCLENRLGEMKGLAAELDSCQRSLSDYLDAKRVMYPRFYFISDDELLSVLGSSGHEAVQPLMLKLFDNCKLLQVNTSGQVSGMESEEGENYHFVEGVVPEGPAEEWMTAVDEAMKASLYGITKDGVFLYGCKPSSSNFDWESQLRFYWDAAIGDVEVRQCNGKFRYGYEYQGLNGHLVITPLTDRCIMTLTTALTFFLGGAPAGPAGTGKTETVKDLAKSLAIRCVVQNCGEGLDYKAMGTIFSGLVQTGFWGCFDEFNRINPEVLSVVSAQIKAIQTSLQNGKGSVELLGKSLKFISTTGIFVTMNPGYAGRYGMTSKTKK